MTRILPASTFLNSIAPAVMRFDNSVLSDAVVAQIKASVPLLKGNYELTAYKSAEGDVLILAKQPGLTTPFILHKDGTLTRGLNAEEGKIFKTAMASDDFKDPKDKIAQFNVELLDLKTNKKTIIENVRKKNTAVDGLGNPLTANEVYHRMVHGVKNALKDIKQAQKNFIPADDRRSVTL